MNASLQFITGRNEDMRDIAVVHSALPIGMNIGMEIEIKHRTYVVSHIHVIISSIDDDINCEVIYQIHVREIP